MLGVNLAGAEFGATGGIYGKDYTYPTHDEIDYYAFKGLDVIRLPFQWERVQPTENGPLNAAELGRIEAVVDYAATKGLAVILDVHNYGIGYGHPVGSLETPNSSFSDLWGKLATAFKSDANVMFGLMNEPYLQSATQWVGAANAAIGAIRDAGAAQRILVPGTHWDGAYTWVSSDNDEIVGGGVVDPLKNFSFEVHQYFDADGSGTSPLAVSATIGVERLQQITDWAARTGNTLFLGEFGAANNQTALAAMDGMLNYMQHHGDVWLGATYWAGGPWWGNYMFSIEPTSLTSPVDRPQMDLLEKYAPGASAGAPVPAPTAPPPIAATVQIARADASSLYDEGQSMAITVTVTGAVAGQTFDFWQANTMGAGDFVNPLAQDFAAALPQGVTFTSTSDMAGTVTLKAGSYSFTLHRQTASDGVTETLDQASWVSGNQEQTDINIGHFHNGLQAAGSTVISNWVTDVAKVAATTKTSYGTPGNDTLKAAAGVTLVGGGGNDTFVFLNKPDAIGDVIQDFSQGDRIDLSGIDAKSATSPNDAFAFIQDKAFSGHAGQLHYFQNAGHTFVEGDTNGDRVADFTIDLIGQHKLVASDFIL